MPGGCLVRGREQSDGLLVGVTLGVLAETGTANHVGGGDAGMHAQGDVRVNEVILSEVGEGVDDLGSVPELAGFLESTGAHCSATSLPFRRHADLCFERR